MKTGQGTLYSEIEKEKRINSFLKCLPSLTGISEIGMKNICSRFGITRDELEERIKDNVEKQKRRH